MRRAYLNSSTCVQNIIRNSEKVNVKNDPNKYAISFEEFWSSNSFTFGKVNYARWESINLESCLKLIDMHPDMMTTSGRFVVQQTKAYQ